MVSEWKLAQENVWEKQNGSGFHADRFRRVHELAVHRYRGKWGDVYKSPQHTNEYEMLIPHQHVLDEELLVVAERPTRRGDATEEGAARRASLPRLLRAGVVGAFIQLAQHLRENLLKARGFRSLFESWYTHFLPVR